MSESHDREMENLLGRAGGPFPDVNVAYRAVQDRVRRAQRRRALATSGVAFSLLLGAGVLAVNRSGGNEPVQSGASDSSEVRLQPDTTSVVTTSIAPSTTELATTTVATTTTTTTVPETTAPPPVVDPATQDPAVTAPKSTAPKSTAPKSTTPKTTTPTTTPTTAPPNTATPAVPVDDGGATTATTPKGSPRPVTSTFSGEGGSIVVRMDGNRVTLVSYEPAAGFQAAVRRHSGSHVEVRFDSGDHRTVARVDLEDGTMVPHFEESDS